MHINVNSVKVSNDSLIDWNGSTNIQPHSFNVIGAVYLNSGTHQVQLMASRGKFNVGAQTNLSILTRPAENIAVSSTQQDTGIFNFTTFGLTTGNPLPHSTIISQMVPSFDKSIISLSSGRAYTTGMFGDPLWGIYLNGQGERNDSATWSDNDLFSGAELQAPMFNQAFFSGVPDGQNTVSLEASELPYDNQMTENQVRYRVGANTKLITLSGGMRVVGKAPISSQTFNRTDYLCIGTNIGNPGCPSTGTDVLISQATFKVPGNPSGVVMFMTKTRIQGDMLDAGGTISLWITINDKRVGSTGFQKLQSPNSESTRTLSASYLAAGSQRLYGGRFYTVKVYGRADGSFRGVSMLKDLPLIWFD